MRDGYRIIDMDTHVGPALELLQQHASKELLEQWSFFDPYLRPGPKDWTQDYHRLSVNPIPYDRLLGTKGKQQVGVVGGKPSLDGSTHSRRRIEPELGIQHDNSLGRLAAMDKERVDIDLIIPGTFATASTAFPVDIAIGLYAAFHRYIDDYCSVDPSRLKATMLVPGADPEWAAGEIRSLLARPWLAAVTLLLPEGMSVDDPDLAPIWEAMQDGDLPLLHHSFFYEPPYFPGYRDIWGNLVVARTAAHPWGAQRLLAYLILSGLFDRYPSLRVGFAETGAGWLPYWLRRLGMQADYLRGSVPALKHFPIDYARRGQVFCGLEFYEGPETVIHLNNELGNGCVMYQSDFPHAQCEYPDSPDIVLGWQGISPDDMRRFLGENAAAYLRLV